jgi:multidrug efflux pump subunit AcrB
MGISEATVYIKSDGISQVNEIETRANEYIAREWPLAVHSCQASGNIFDMLFQDKEAPLVARIKNIDGSTPEPDELSTLLYALRAALPELYIQQPEWNEYIELITDPERLALYGVSFNQIMSYLQNSMNAGSVLRISRGDFSMPVVIGVGTKEAKDLIQGSYINTQGGRVPLEILLKETRNRDLKQIASGVDGEFYPLVLDVRGREARRVMDVVKKVVRDDDRFEVSFSGTYFSNREMIKELCAVLAISILLLFFILAAQFESMLQPFIILSELIIDIFAVWGTLCCSARALTLCS